MAWTSGISEPLMKDGTIEALAKPLMFFPFKRSIDTTIKTRDKSVELWFRFF